MRRLATAGAIASVALVAAVAGCSGSSRLDTAGRPLPAQYRGVMLHSLWDGSTPADTRRELAAARALGANAVRVDVGWSTLERDGPGPSADYLGRLDRFMDLAGRHGLGVVVNLSSTPCWASSAPTALRQGCRGAWWERGVQAYPPRDPADFAAVARFVTRRYGARLAALELWNEPNQPQARAQFLRGPDRPGAYARLVRAAYPAAKSGDTGVPVLAGALAFADTRFLRTLYARGIRGYADGISVHPYTDGRAPSAWGPADRSLLKGLFAIRRTMLDAGDTSPLWVTEYGWTTGASAGSARVDERTQADYLARGARLLAALPWVRGQFAYNLRDKAADPADSEANFGLLRRDFAPKPAYRSLERTLQGRVRG